MDGIKLLLVAGILGLSALAHAGEGGTVSSLAMNPGGYYFGLGGSYNQARVKSSTWSVLDAASGMPPTGVFSGAGNDNYGSASVVSPQIQAGYFQNFSGSNWLWGIELLYQYSKAGAKSRDSTVNLINLPVNTTDAIGMDIQTKVNSAFVLPAFIGHSFVNSFIYLGAGPSLVRIHDTVYASSDGFSGYYIGTLNRFSDTHWRWGGAAQVGMAYSLNPSWFLKLDYTYTAIGRYERNNFIAFSPEINGGLNAGTVRFNTRQRLATQDVALTINKLFAV
ncbi:outer membrane protein [Legionella shakespearei]|uniref:Outer membrane protein beta-barrel domain-containing protein n=1 Tax=Legionella shakespearei DSM 23087 TaxID=1122169 RepID=A0A0W0YHW1_9GAMM|nr:outer membrane beta-barrel protein [Legionella shakespearei]KTD56480.1 hypothetical protein Lsha_2879 [Legionella shakespearei DSM 23087]